MYVGAYDKELLLDRVNAEVRKKGDISRIAGKYGMCARKFYSVLWPAVKARREKHKQYLARLRAMSEVPERVRRAMESLQRHWEKFTARNR